MKKSVKQLVRDALGLRRKKHAKSDQSLMSSDDQNVQKFDGKRLFCFVFFKSFQSFFLPDTVTKHKPASIVTRRKKLRQSAGAVFREYANLYFPPTMPAWTAVDVLR